MDSTYALRQAVLAQLAGGAWPPGHRLPTERELGERYGISRTTVRRVLGELKDRGLITQTVGSGTYVTERAAQQPPRAATRATSPAELMDARLAIEPAIVELVIANATPADFERMQACCTAAEAATTVEEFERWDGALHEAIADAAHNGFVSSVFRLMNEVRNQGEWGLLKKRSLTPERRLDYQKEHRRLVAALKNRDLEQARKRLGDHLRHVRRNLLGG